MKHISTVLFMLGVMSSIFGTFIINRTVSKIYDNGTNIGINNTSDHTPFYRPISNGEFALTL